MIVGNSCANLKFNSLPLWSLLLGFSINAFLSHSEYLVYFTVTQMAILYKWYTNGNTTNILVIRWQQ